MNTAELLKRESFIELGARERARALLDAGTMRELIGPFDRLASPWLAAQGVVTQADDGVVVARGRIDGQSAVVLAIEGAYQGGSMGEVGGAKIAGALELAAFLGVTFPSVADVDAELEDGARGLPLAYFVSPDGVVTTERGQLKGYDHLVELVARHTGVAVGAG